MKKTRTIQAAVLSLCLAGYIWLGYFTTRTDFTRLILIYFLLFGLYLFICYSRNFRYNLKIVIGGALLLRLSLLLMTPNLSDDYFRFIWDGLLVGSGYNPYLMIPADFLNVAPAIPEITPALYAQLNSPYYHSAYPPLAQFVFALSAKLSGGSLLGNIIWLRVFIMLAEFGTILLISKILSRFRQPPGLVVLYAFNPLIIMELTGNLHFEAVMIFFLLLAVYLLIRERPLRSAISFGLAISAKLLPVIFLPLLIRRLGLVKSLKYFAVTGAVVLLLFAPFLNMEAISNYFSSLALYFRVFEFNASVFYVIRWLGEQAGSDSIPLIARIALPVITFISIITIAAREKGTDWASLFPVMLLCLSVYLLFSTGVHPWNLTPLVILAVFTRYRYVLPWSLLIVLAYATYQTIPYAENPWLVAVEYVVVLGWAAWEIRANRVSPRIEKGFDHAS
jgi:alpha-1,6-mannosyltransferase